LRLGSVASITSKKRGASGAQVKIDWSTYHSAGSVDEVELDVRDCKRSAIGSTVTMSRVPAITDYQIQRIARSLALVSDPFSRSGAFKVRFGGSRVSPKLRQEFRKGFFRYASYRIRAAFNGDDTLQIDLYRGQRLWKHETITKRYQAPPFVFELWEFNLSAHSLSLQPIPKRDLGDWIGTFGGIHLFDGPIRIAPAGDKPVDWLDMNLMRVRSPELRPSTNNSIGRVVLDNSKGLIVQTTDRVSFVDNPAYDDLKDACRSVLNWAAKKRTQEREMKRQTDRAQKPQTHEAQTSAFQQLRTVLSREQLVDVEPLVARAFEEAAREVKTLRSDIVLYRAMATAGITATVFAHEISQSLGVLRRRLPAVIEAVSKAGLNVVASLDLVQNAVRRLSAYIDLPGRFAASVRRKSTTIDVNHVLTESINSFQPIIAEDGIDVDFDASTAEILVRSSKAMLEAVIANLITNSVQAFRRGLNIPTHKQIRIKTRTAGRSFVIEIEDNAGGIKGLDPKDIWLPGETTTPGGTGFGLTIVRDTMTDMDGEIRVIPRTRFGGAKFTITLPRL
jgi:signal transduction histidine kinase